MVETDASTDELSHRDKPKSRKLLLYGVSAAGLLFICSSHRLFAPVDSDLALSLSANQSGSSVFPLEDLRLLFIARATKSTRPRT